MLPKIFERDQKIFKHGQKIFELADGLGIRYIMPFKSWYVVWIYHILGSSASRN